MGTIATMRALWLVTIPFVLAGCMAPSGFSDVVAAQSAEGLNLVIVAIDSLRPDHLGSYGYSRRNVSSFIDSLAANGIVFENAFSHSSYTRESVAALLTGILPSANPTGGGWDARLNPDALNMADFFSKAGYKTGFFSDHPVFGEEPSFVAHFDETGLVPTAWRVSGSGPQLSARALEFASDASTGKFMMYVHYLDPHTPYQPFEEYYRRFADTMAPKPLDLCDDIQPNLPQLMKEGFGPGEARFEDTISRYDAEIAETDDALQSLLNGLRSLGVLDNTLVVVTADHGEEFLDHKFVEHAWTLYNEVLHVPLILWRPGVLKPSRIAICVSLGDLLPTLTRLMAVPCQTDNLTGTPWFLPDGNQWRFAPPTKPIISELLLETRGIMRAVIDDKYKYIAAQRWFSPVECVELAKTQKESLDAFKVGTLPLPDLWGPVVHEELYDLSADPAERTDLSDALPEKRAELAQDLIVHTKKYSMIPRIPYSRQGKPTPTSEQQEELEALGYL